MYCDEDCTCDDKCSECTDCCEPTEEEETIADILLGYKADAKEKLEEFIAKGKEQAESLEKEVNAAVDDVKDYVTDTKECIAATYETAKDEKHIGYLVMSTGVKHLKSATEKILESTPSELDPKTLEGLGRITVYGGQGLFGWAVTKTGAGIFVTEEGIRYLKKRAKDKAAEEDDIVEED